MLILHETSELKNWLSANGTRTVNVPIIKSPYKEKEREIETY
jgi:hypothetical protein